MNKQPAGNMFSVVSWWTHDRDDTPPTIRRRLAAELIAVSWSFYAVVQDAIEVVVSNLPVILEVADLRQIHVKLYGNLLPGLRGGAWPSVQGLLNCMPLPSLNICLWMLLLTSMAFVKTVVQRGRQASETAQQVEAPAAKPAEFNPRDPHSEQTEPMPSSYPFRPSHVLCVTPTNTIHTLDG